MLGACVNDAIWEPAGAWTRARCLAGHGSPHHAPAGACSCGLYAYHATSIYARQIYAEYLGVDDGAEEPWTDPVEEVGVAGIIEACGRLEVHEYGFRAERARPHALLIGVNWNQASRRLVEDLASRYDVALLEIDGGDGLAAYCRECGKPLEQRVVNELLELEPDELVHPSSIRPVPGWPPVPATPPTRRARALGRLAPVGEWVLIVVANIIGGLLAVGFYGGFALILVGGVLGWWDVEPTPAPAKIREIHVNRDRCVVTGEVVARRDLKHLRISVKGRDSRGDYIGGVIRDVGPLSRGRSKVTLAHPTGKVCRMPEPFTVRARPVWPERLGRTVQVKSRPTP
jgi:hypothetical protein